METVTDTLVNAVRAVRRYWATPSDDMPERDRETVRLAMHKRNVRNARRRHWWLRMQARPHAGGPT